MYQVPRLCVPLRGTMTGACTVSCHRRTCITREFPRPIHPFRPCKARMRPVVRIHGRFPLRPITHRARNRRRDRQQNPRPIAVLDPLGAVRSQGRRPSDENLRGSSARLDQGFPGSLVGRSADPRAVSEALLSSLALVRLVSPVFVFFFYQSLQSSLVHCPGRRKPINAMT